MDGFIGLMGIHGVHELFVVVALVAMSCATLVMAMVIAYLVIFQHMAVAPTHLVVVVHHHHQWWPSLPCPPPMPHAGGLAVAAIAWVDDIFNRIEHLRFFAAACAAAAPAAALAAPQAVLAIVAHANVGVAAGHVDDSDSDDSDVDCTHWTFSLVGSNQFNTRARCRLCGLYWVGPRNLGPPWPLVH